MTDLTKLNGREVVVYLRAHVAAWALAKSGSDAEKELSKAVDAAELELLRRLQELRSHDKTALKFSGDNARL